MKAPPAKHQKGEKQEVAPPDDEDKDLYNDNDNSLPDLFVSQDPIVFVIVLKHQNSKFYSFGSK